MNIDILKLGITIDSGFSISDARRIRGFFGNAFRDNHYAHNHLQDGSFIYGYPLIQYKIVENLCLIVGISEGMDMIKTIFSDLKMIKIGHNWEEILHKGLNKTNNPFGISNDEITYEFITPWLALNEANHKKYSIMGFKEKKKLFLERIILGNIISMSKGLKYTIPDTIKINLIKFKEIQTSLKGTPMLGFMGTFRVNFEIPDYFGLGKSVSRGFGTIVRVD